MLNNVVENAVAMNNSNNRVEKNSNQNKLMAALITLVVVLVINLVVGPFLWNEVMCHLVPACGKARWYDTVALGILLSLVLPN